MKTKHGIRALLWAATLLVAGVIWWFSGQSAAESSELSGKVTSGLFGRLFAFLELSEEAKIAVHVLIRSAAHVAVFAVLGLCLALLLRSYAVKRWWLFSSLIGMAYAVVDECHQLWAAGRAFELADLWKDSLGVWLAIGFVALICKRKEQKRTGV